MFANYSVILLFPGLQRLQLDMVLNSLQEQSHVASLLGYSSPGELSAGLALPPTPDRPTGSVSSSSEAPDHLHLAEVLLKTLLLSIGFYTVSSDWQTQKILSISKPWFNFNLILKYKKKKKLSKHIHLRNSLFPKDILEMVFIILSFSCTRLGEEICFKNCHSSPTLEQFDFWKTTFLSYNLADYHYLIYINNN